MALHHPLYPARLKRTFKTDEKHPDIYEEGSWQYVYQCCSGFLVLTGRRTKAGAPGWVFYMSARPGVDFEWSYGADPRTLEEKTRAIDLGYVNTV